MNWIKTAVLVMLLAFTAASDIASAQHRGPRVGVYIGGPLWWGGYPPYYAPYSPYYYPPSYYYPPVVQSSPPVYIEQPPAPAAAATVPEPGYWYYCRASQGYYPYVKECPTPWERVAPQPSR